MKKLVLVLAFSATSVGICAMEKTKVESRPQREAQALEEVPEWYDAVNKGYKVILCPGPRSAPILVSADLSSAQILQAEADGVEVRVDSPLEEERLFVEDQAEVQTVRQLLIDAYAAGGKREAGKAIKAFFRKPLGEAPDGMDPELWQRFALLEKPTLKINSFAYKIKDEVLLRVESILENPNAATIGSINETLALLVPLKLHVPVKLHDPDMRNTAISHIHALENLRKQKQAGN